MEKVVDSKLSFNEHINDLFNSSWGRNLFGKIIYGNVILNGRTNDQIMPRWGGVSSIINAFSSILNTVNAHWKIKPRPFYKIVKGS